MYVDTLSKREDLGLPAYEYVHMYILLCMYVHKIEQKVQKEQHLRFQRGPPP